MRNICVLPNKQFVTNKLRAISNLGTRRFVFCVKLLDCLLAQIYLLIGLALYPNSVRRVTVYIIRDGNFKYCVHACWHECFVIELDRRNLLATSALQLAHIIYLLGFALYPISKVSYSLYNLAQ